MGVYLGTNKVRVIMDGVLYDLHIAEVAPVITGIKLLSSDGYVLKDLNGLYITTKEGENNGE